MSVFIKRSGLKPFKRGNIYIHRVYINIALSDLLAYSIKHECLQSWLLKQNKRKIKTKFSL